MLLMALQPAPPTPMTLMRGFRSESFGSCSLMLIALRALPMHVDRALRASTPCDRGPSFTRSRSSATHRRARSIPHRAPRGPANPRPLRFPTRRRQAAPRRSKTPGCRHLDGSPTDGTGVATRAGRPSVLAANSPSPTSALAPPVRTTRSPAKELTPALSKRSRTMPSMPATRGRMIPARCAFVACPRAPSSSPASAYEKVSNSSD